MARDVTRVRAASAELKSEFVVHEIDDEDACVQCEGLRTRPSSSQQKRPEKSTGHCRRAHGSTALEQCREVDAAVIVQRQTVLKA